MKENIPLEWKYGFMTGFITACVCFFIAIIFK